METSQQTRKLESRQLSAILILGLILQLAYFSVTGPTVRVHDIEGHLAYIRFIANSLSLPPANYCWECVQPPGYYFLAAAFYRLMMTVGVRDLARGLQLFSLSIFFAYQWVGIKVICHYLSERRARLLASALLVFWPSGFLHSVRIGNDGLSYLFQALTLLFLLNWIQTKDEKWIWRASCIAGLGFLVKATSMISAASQFFQKLSFLVREEGSLIQTCILSSGWGII